VVLIRLPLQTLLAHDTKARQPDLTLVHRIVILLPQLQTLLALRIKVWQVERTLVHQVVITLPRHQPLLAHDARTQQADQTPMAHRRRLVASIRNPRKAKANARL